MAEISPSNESLSRQDHTVTITSLPKISSTEKKVAAFHDLSHIINNISLSCLNQLELKEESEKLNRRFKYYRDQVIEDVLDIERMMPDMVKFSSQLEQKSFQVGFENEELKQIFSKNINLLQEKLEEAPIFINPDHYEVNKQDTNLNDFILHFFNDISEAFPDREQDLRLINPDTNTFCSLDPILTRKTLENFIYNSVKYSPKSSDISVSCSETDKDIKISVKDFGIGFTSQELDSLQNLNPGKQARFSPDKAQGSGFGLYNAISYALNQGAYVEVSSSGKDIGLGSTFSIVFPK